MYFAALLLGMLLGLAWLSPPRKPRVARSMALWRLGLSSPPTPSRQPSLAIRGSAAGALSWNLYQGTLHLGTPHPWAMQPRPAGRPRPVLPGPAGPHLRLPFPITVKHWDLVVAEHKGPTSKLVVPSVAHASPFWEMTDMCSIVRDRDTFRTLDFLAVCDRVVGLADALGHSFAPVKSEIGKDIAILRAHFLADPVKNGDLFAMVLDDVHTAGTGDGTCACSLVWLKRSMDLMVALIATLARERDLPMAAAASRAYAATLQPHHSHVVQWMVHHVVKTLPDRAAVEQALGRGEDIYASGRAFGDAFAPLLNEVHGWLVAHDLDTTDPL